MQLEPWQWVAVLVTSFVAATLQGTIGFGYAVLAVPVLSLIDPSLVPVPQILTALPMTLWAAAREWRSADLRGAMWILLGRIPGALVGALLLHLATQRTLDFAIGSIVLLAVVLLSTKLRLPRAPAVDFGVGAFATATGYVSAIGGPPVALLLRGERAATLRPTLGVVFAVGIVVTLSVRAASGQISVRDLRLGALLLPAVLLGMHASRSLHRYFEGNALRRGVLVTSAVAALGLLFRSLFVG